VGQDTRMVVTTGERNLIRVMVLLLMCGVAGAASISLTTPITNEDGSQLMDLAGVRIYFDGVMVQEIEVYATGVQVDTFIRHNFFRRVRIEATAFDLDGNESVFSEPVFTRRYRCYSCHDNT